MKNKMISQYTPFTCSLDCLSSYLKELNFGIDTSDILKNHRDLCFNNPPNAHTFGAIDNIRFKLLCERYLLVYEEKTISNISDISKIIPDSCLLVSCSRFQGRDINHTVRVVGIGCNKDKIQIFSPHFPHGESILTTPDCINTTWGKVTWMEIKPLR